MSQTVTAVVRVLAQALSLRDGAAGFNRDTPLLGSIPELDSMAVVNVITGLEDAFGFTVADDDLDADTFATVGTLSDFVDRKLGG